MRSYYTRACNFYYGSKSKTFFDKNKTLPLNGSHQISFDHIEIISRKFRKKIPIKNIKNLSKEVKKTSSKRFKTYYKKKKI